MSVQYQTFRCLAVETRWMRRCEHLRGRVKMCPVFERMVMMEQRRRRFYYSLPPALLLLGFYTTLVLSSNPASTNWVCGLELS